MAVEDDLCLSRSPLPLAEPAWFELAETMWQRICALSGVGLDAARARAGAA
jgi:hypothetical protein